MERRDERWYWWLPLSRKMPVKSKGQRHVLSAGVFLSAFPYGDLCRPRHHTRKQWLFASDCVSREKVRQPGGRTLCLWGTFGVLSRGPVRRRKIHASPAIILSLTKNERGPFVLRSREKYYLERNFNCRNYDQPFSLRLILPSLKILHGFQVSKQNYLKHFFYIQFPWNRI